MIVALLVVTGFDLSQYTLTTHLHTLMRTTESSIDAWVDQLVTQSVLRSGPESGGLSRGFLMFMQLCTNRYGPCRLQHNELMSVFSVWGIRELCLCDRKCTQCTTT